MRERVPGSILLCSIALDGDQVLDAGANFVDGSRVPNAPPNSALPRESSPEQNGTHVQPSQRRHSPERGGLTRDDIFGGDE